MVLYNRGLNIQQWGLSKSRTPITFPVAFTVTPICIGVHIGTVSTVNVINDTSVQSNTKIQFADSYTDSVYVQWIAIGH